MGILLRSNRNTHQCEKVEKQEQLKREDINGQKNIKEPENINDQKWIEELEEAKNNIFNVS